MVNTHVLTLLIGLNIPRVNHHDFINTSMYAQLTLSSLSVIINLGGIYGLDNILVDKKLLIGILNFNV